jgi:exopolyphosphatase/guanosine-5'-triphosphate,3'-diphosphate pyrophosphatase
MDTLLKYQQHKSSVKKHSEVVAAIDIGTNTAHLLVIALPEQRNIFTPFRILHKEKIATKIGEGGISHGFITQQAQERLLKALVHFKEVLEHYQIPTQQVFAIATSAFRNAQNRQEIIDYIKEQTQIEISVISGDQEAEYIYYGVKTALKIGKGNALIMDIGGGSVEFILCNEEKMLWKQSFEIGAQRLLDKFMKDEIISHSEIQALHEYLEEVLAPLSHILQDYAPNILIGCSGTFDTIDDINHIKKHKKINLNAKESAFSLEEFQVIHQEFLHKNHQERLAIPGMTPMRADMIVVASCLLNFVLTKYQIPCVRVSHYALKEGVISKHFAWV